MRSSRQYQYLLSNKKSCPCIFLPDGFSWEIQSRNKLWKSSSISAPSATFKTNFLENLHYPIMELKVSGETVPKLMLGRKR